MADKFDTPSNIEFTQQNIDTTLGQEFGSPPSDLDYDICFLNLMKVPLRG